MIITNILEYYGIVGAVPKGWKTLISEYGMLHDIKNVIVDRLKSDKKPKYANILTRATQSVTYLLAYKLDPVTLTFDLEKPEALKNLYRSPGYKKNHLVLCKNCVLQW